VDVCDPPCAAGSHCEAGVCADNVCSPACEPWETCVVHGGTECVCLAPPCEPTPCQDGIDNDGDGWTDDGDPDCDVSTGEVGLGTAGCNDGIDNDGDGLADAADPQCTSGRDDEVVGAGECADACVAGSAVQGKSCQLWDSVSMAWVDGWEDGPGHMHNRARNYTTWLRSKMMPEGGVMRAWYSDSTYAQVAGYGGTRDAPIWTGIYLAAEALRHEVTGSSDAAEQMEKTVRTLDFWWNISGDPGYLARFVAPASSPEVIEKIFDPAVNENHRDYAYQGSTWHWKGDISRDQYQGVLMGYVLAYDVTTDASLKEIVRSNVVEFAETLMRHETRQVQVSVNGTGFTMDMNLGHAVYTDDETPGGVPTLAITTNPFELVDDGFTIFWPDPKKYLQQIPGLGLLPTIYLRGQAIQLAAAFAAALHVSDGVPAYAARRQALLQHYEANVQEWMNIALGWTDTNNCGDSYHGLNIAFLPAYVWAKLESNPARKAVLQTQLLRDAMWPAVFDHKNVFFAYIYGSQAHPTDDPSAAITFHTDQLRLFPSAPLWAWPVDNTASYPADNQCEGLSSVAIDVDDRVPESFLWEKNPWKLQDPGTPNFLYPGVDYLITYWMARHYGYLTDDAPGTCLQWRE